MKPLFLASHPALDFLNTRPAPRGTAIELIGATRLVPAVAPVKVASLARARAETPVAA